MSKSSFGTGKVLFTFIVMLLLLATLFFISVNTGSLKIGFAQLFNGLFVSHDDTVATIYNLRFPRILISMLAGAALAVSGVLIQAVMKNPVADPGIIGISGGAGFAAVIITAIFPSMIFLAPIFAFSGGLLAFIIVYTLAWNAGLNPMRLILVGIAVSAMFTGLSNAFNSFSGGNLSGVAAIVNGNITLKTWTDVNTLFWYVLVGLVLSLFLTGKCNLLALEDNTIRSLGVDVDRARIMVSVISVLLASISTAIIGIIGFLGLIAPHIARILVGSDHKVLIPFSMMLGAFILLLADTVGRTVATPYEISAGILMAVFGGPFFIMLLKRSGKEYAN